MVHYYTIVSSTSKKKKCCTLSVEILARYHQEPMNHLWALMGSWYHEVNWMIFIYSEVWVDKWQCLEKSSLINKRYAGEPHPARQLLTIQINFEFGRVEINDGRVLRVEKDRELNIIKLYMHIHICTCTCIYTIIFNSSPVRISWTLGRLTLPLWIK